MISDDVRSALSPLLPHVRLRAINVHGLEVRRRAGDKLAAETEMQSTIGQAFRADDDSFGYRTVMTVDNEAIFLEVILSAEYELKGASEVLGATHLQAAFGQHIALPAMWPFMRQRVHDLSAAVGIPPILMPMLLPDDVILELVAPDDEPTDTQG